MFDHLRKLDQHALTATYVALSASVAAIGVVRGINRFLTQRETRTSLAFKPQDAHVQRKGDDKIPAMLERGDHVISREQADWLFDQWDPKPRCDCDGCDCV